MKEDIFSNPEEISKIILEIVIGEKIIEFHYPESDKPTVLILKQPTGRDKLWANYIESKSLREAVALGIPREDDLPEELIEQFFTEEDEDHLSKLLPKSEAYQKMVDKGITGSTVHSNNKEKLAKLKDDIKTLQAKRDLSKQLSADFKATEDRYYALMSKCVLNINREPVWNSLEELEEETDIGYLETLLYHHFLPFYVGYGTKILRYIARSGQWGNRYYASKNTGMDLFSRLPEDFSIDQLVLISWSTFYFDISQMAEEYRPDDDVLENDEALDEYVDELSRRLKAERFARKKEKGLSSSKSKLNSQDHQNVIVTAGNSQYVDLHKSGVYNNPKDMTGRSKDPKSSTSYSESAAIREKKNKLRSKRREKAKKLRDS